MFVLCLCFVCIDGCVIIQPSNVNVVVRVTTATMVPDGCESYPDNIQAVSVEFNFVVSNIYYIRTVVQLPLIITPKDRATLIFVLAADDNVVYFQYHPRQLRCQQ